MSQYSRIEGDSETGPDRISKLSLNLQLTQPALKHCLFILTFLVSAGLRGQDYLITSRSDTLRGKVTIEGYEKLDKILLTVNKKKTQYPAYSVLRIFVDSAVYQPVRTPEAIRFMRLSKSGMLSLFYARQSPGTPYNIPYLVKITGESMEVTALRFKKSVSRFLEDCTSMSQVIEDQGLGREDLDKILEIYNRCLERQSTVAFTDTEDPKLAAVTAFNKKIEKDTAVPADASEILRDIYNKVKEGKPVPNYLADGLRETLKDFPAYRDELEALLVTLKK